MNFSGAYGRAALFFLISAVLHLVVIAVSGGNHVQDMIFGTIAWTLISLGLLRHWRLVAYFGFLFSLFGAIAAFSLGLGEHGLTQIALFGISVADILGGLMLFGIIWRDPAAKSQSA